MDEKKAENHSEENKIPEEHSESITQEKNTEQELAVPPEQAEGETEAVHKPVRNRKKTITAIVIGCIILALAAGACLFFLMRHKEADQTVAPTQIPRQEDEQQGSGYFGSLAAASTVKVIPDAKGQVLESPYNLGDRVTAGSLIFSIDDGGIADNIATTKNSIKKAELTIATADENIANLKVYAPETGILKNFSLKDGERVNAGKIGDIVNENQLLVKVPFNEGQIRKIAVGDTAQIISAQYMTSASGKVTRIYDARADSVGGSVLYDVEIQGANSGGFSVGDEVSARIETASGTVSSPVGGTVETGDSVSVVSKGSGNVLRTYVKEGQKVTKGTLILEIENSTVTTAKQRAELDKNDLEIKLKSLEDDYRDCTIYAPASGLITQKTKNIHDNITSNSDSIMIISDIDTLVWNVDLSETDAKRLTEGQTVVLQTDSAEHPEINAVVAGISKQGKISGAEMKYTARLTVNNQYGLMPGVNVSMTIE